MCVLYLLCDLPCSRPHCWLHFCPAFCLSVGAMLTPNLAHMVTCQGQEIARMNAMLRLQGGLHIILAIGASLLLDMRVCKA